MHLLMLDYINRRRRPGRTDIALLATGLLIMALSAAAAAWVFPSVVTLEAEQAAAHQQEIAIATPAPPSAMVDTTHLRAELNAANSVVGLMSLPWDALFGDIEASENAQVALLAVEPDPDKRTLLITAEAKNFDAMLAYMRRLQTRASLKDVYLKSHQIDLKSAEVPVRFVLAASWVVKP